MNISITSIGRACSEIQAMPNRINDAAKELGLEPAATIDGRIYYTEDDVQAIGDLLHQSGNRFGPEMIGGATDA